jgi:uroporphyrinogen-III decarboxylase
MLPRERVLAAIQFQPPDVTPLRIYPAPGGLFEHGQKLADLISACGHDFGDLSRVPLPEPPGPCDFDPEGRYHAVRTDAWGTTWEYRIFGVWGHPVVRPLDDLSQLQQYQPPPPPRHTEAELAAERANAALHQQRFFLLGHGGSIFEPLHSLRRFEEVLMDIAEDRPELHRIADMLTEHAMANVQHSLAVGVDGVAFGDDYGTQTAMLVSPTAWRRFFKPRYQALFEPIRRAHKSIFLHCCGHILPILEDLAELGVNVLWPQITAYSGPELARRCRELRIAVELHPDRGDLMQHGTPAQVRAHVAELLRVFGTPRGGSWLYIEIDPGFPFANVQALFELAMELRRGR